MAMTTSTLADGTQYARNRAAQQVNAVDRLVRIGDLSRIVERDIEILKTNLTKYHYGRDRNETWEDAWARLESAWETVRSEIADGKASTPPVQVTPPAGSAFGATPQIDETVMAQTASETRNHVSYWQSLTSRKRRLGADLRQALDRRFGDFTNFAHKFALASTAHLRSGWLWLVANGRKQVKLWEIEWARLESAFADGEVSTPVIEVALPATRASGANPQIDQATTTSLTAPFIDRGFGDFANFAREFALTGATHLRSGWRRVAANGRKHLRLLMTSKTKANLIEIRVRTSDASDIGQERDVTSENARARLESARETVRSKLAGGKTSISLTEVASPATRTPSAIPPVDEMTANSSTGPFVLKPLPWVLGALAPVISSRTMQIHHGCHYSRCIESANRLSRNYKELADKRPLEIVRWAREHARDTELLAAASEAWNHAFFWQSLTPWKKRPGGDLGRALNRVFGDFTDFAGKFALAGATHVGSGWLWLVANRRKQVKILTTSDADCPEARGHTCLLAIDLWEHAYYFDHQNRRREYLDAVIDRRLDWEFAENRYRLVLERNTHARRETARRPCDRNRGRHKRQRKPGASRR
jgi:Fe-Mn family superoxide dismutase